eukprot:13230822-Alexandrium_andersonii.AAC.1
MVLSERAGAPRAVMDTWYRYMHNLQTANCLVGTIGQPYRRAASVPQGCPLSMQWLALVMRPMLLL